MEIKAPAKEKQSENQYIKQAVHILSLLKAKNRTSQSLFCGYRHLCNPKAFFILALLTT